ncbi:MAG: phosphatase PAP2 family protein [Solirubrobacterales bacterium]
MRNPDLALLRLMRTRGHARPVEAAARAIAASGEYGAVWAVGGLVAAAVDRRRRAGWLVAGALAPAAIGLNFGIKLAVRRPRPVLEGLPPLGGAPSSLSFPSAHATSSFAAAAAMGRVAPRRRRGLLAAAALIGLTRPYLGMHYPSDVLAGAALGSALGSALPLPPPSDAP